MNNLLEYLRAWYESKCDGKWEHVYGIKIETLNNPGWIVIVSGEQQKKRISLSLEYTQEDWLHIEANGCEFKGVGDPNKLEEILGYVKEWLGSTEQDQVVH